MSQGLNDFLSKFDSQYQQSKNTVAADDKPQTFEEISDGRYIAFISGQGWRDYQNMNPDGWSGMGPIVRLRIASGRNGETSRFKGWKEDLTYFLFSVHPDRGIHSPELNEKKLAFFLRQMERIQANAPSKMGDLAGWEGAVGMSVFITIQTKKDGDRTYRNVYFDGRANHVDTEEDYAFRLEKYVDQRWEETNEVRGKEFDPSVKDESFGAAESWPKNQSPNSPDHSVDDIPF